MSLNFINIITFITFVPFALSIILLIVRIILWIYCLISKDLDCNKINKAISEENSVLNKFNNIKK